jgi:hypothetical protein
MAKKSKKKSREPLDRHFQVMRLTNEDKKLVLGLWQGRSTRHQAMLELVPFVKPLDLPKLVTPKRSPVRLGIPADLMTAIVEKQEETKQPVTTIFLEAARAYRDAHPQLKK